MNSVSFSKVDSKVVAEELIGIVTHVMKGSQTPTVNFAEKYDLGFTQLKLMFVLSAADEPLPIGHLAELIGSSLPSAGRAVDGLVRHGLATRTEDPEDRRVKRIEATELGTTSMNAINKTRVTTLAQILDQLSGDQIAALSAALVPLCEETEASR